MLDLATFRDNALNHPVAFAPENLGATINTNDDEYVNMLSFDGLQLLFTRKMPLGNGYQKEFLFVSQWDGKQWKVISDWYTGDDTIIEPLVKATAAKYAAEKKITPRDCSKEN